MEDADEENKPPRCVACGNTFVLRIFVIQFVIRKASTVLTELCTNSDLCPSSPHYSRYVVTQKDILALPKVATPSESGVPKGRGGGRGKQAQASGSYTALTSGAKVMAMFPDTTSFYPAVVAQGGGASAAVMAVRECRLDCGVYRGQLL